MVPCALYLHAVAPHEPEEVEMFYKQITLLCREGGLSNADVMSLTRQQRTDRIHALAEVLRPKDS